MDFFPVSSVALEFFSFESLVFTKHLEHGGGGSICRE